MSLRRSSLYVFESSSSSGTSVKLGSPYHASRSAKASFADLGHEVDEVGAAGLDPGPVPRSKPASRASCCRKTGPWPHGPVLQTVRPVVVVGDRRLQAGVPGGQVVAGEQAAVPFAGDVHHLGGGELADLLGDEPVVPGLPGGLDLLVAVAAGRLRLGQDPLVGGGERGVGEPGAGRGHAAAGQVDLGRGVPVLAEEVGHAGDRPADRGDEGVAGLRVPDRVAEHVAQAQRAVLAQQQQPAAERAGHARGQQPAARHQVEAEAGVRLDGGGGRARCPARRPRTSRPRRASCPMTGTSPPGPFRCGSTTWSTNPAATAASNALPPRSSTAIPAAEASQWVEATIPNVPASSGLVVNSEIVAISAIKPHPSWPREPQAHSGSRPAGPRAARCVPVGDGRVAR